MSLAPVTNTFWGILVTQPRREVTARDNAMNQGFRTFLPMYREGSKPEEPLFPGYVFVLIEGRWWSLQNTIGVRAVLMMGHLPARVPESQMAELIERCGQLEMLCVDPTSIQVNDRVRVTMGALEGFTGTFLGRSGKQRARILLSSVMGKGAYITTINESELEAAPSKVEHA